MVCAVAGFGAATLGTVHAGAAMTRAYAPAKAGVTPASTRTRSGLPWVSGAYLPSGTPAAASAFGTWRKHRLDVVEVWLNQSNWGTITDPAWLYRRWQGSPYIMAFSVAMLPTHVRGASIRACAGGAYDAHWRRFGQVIRSYGLGSSIIRLGWEFNGKWERWAATDPTAWAQCWRRAVTSAWSTAPRLRWDWDVNRGPSSALADPARAYPGNHYVSMIGVDSYDWWPAVSSPGGWHQQLDGTQGLNYWLAFAKAHGKKLSVPEWGSIRYGRSSGGDDPRYIRDMRAFFAANARYLAFETIFQGPAGNYRDGHSMPEAAHAYKAGF
jgi:Glycosyl hydrolase family 26